MSQWYRETFEYLEYKGILTEFPSLNLYLSEEPDKDGAEQMLTIIPTQGFPNDPGEGAVEYPGIQFICRDADFDTVLNILRWVKKTLSKASDLDYAFQLYKEWDDLPIWDTWTEWYTKTSDIFGWENTGTPISLGKDAKNRFRYSDNYIIYSNEEE